MIFTGNLTARQDKLMWVVGDGCSDDYCDRPTSSTVSIYNNIYQFIFDYIFLDISRELLCTKLDFPRADHNCNQQISPRPLQ